VGILLEVGLGPLRRIVRTETTISSQEDAGMAKGDFGHEGLVGTGDDPIIEYGGDLAIERGESFLRVT
jgi:hypothetical protein